jgi:hypothetical protein
MALLVLVLFTFAARLWLTTTVLETPPELFRVAQPVLRRLCTPLHGGASACQFGLGLSWRLSLGTFQCLQLCARARLDLGQQATQLLIAGLGSLGQRLFHMLLHPGDRPVGHGTICCNQCFELTGPLVDEPQCQLYLARWGGGKSQTNILCHRFHWV